MPPSPVISGGVPIYGLTNSVMMNRQGLPTIDISVVSGDTETVILLSIYPVS